MQDVEIVTPGVEKTSKHQRPIRFFLERMGMRLALVGPRSTRALRFLPRFSACDEYARKWKEQCRKNTPQQANKEGKTAKEGEDG